MRDDDVAARFAVFYRSHYPVILATCTRRLGDRSTAEDAAQEVFRIAWQGFATATPTLTWVYAIARNVVGNIYQRSSRSTAELGSEPAIEYDHGGAMDVRIAMQALRTADRELLYMAYWEDLTAREIGSILDISTPAVWVRLTRAREALKHVLVGAIPARGSARG